MSFFIFSLLFFLHEQAGISGFGFDLDLPSSVKFHYLRAQYEMNNLPSEAKGELLHQEVMSFYEVRRTQDPKIRLDIRDLVLKFIPVGTSFSNAEQILRAAGFSVFPRPEPNSSRRDDEYVVTAMLELSAGVGAKVQAIVSLIPKSPADYSSVNELEAEIICSNI